MSVRALPQASGYDRARPGQGRRPCKCDSHPHNEINYGIKTGLNEAFVIDNQTKEELVAEDPRSAEVLKPLVRGRDIRHYLVDWKGFYLIALLPALRYNIDTYPGIKRHLKTFGRARLEQSGTRFSDGTRSRKETNNAWFETQDNCAYYGNFKLPKLFWSGMARIGRFAFSEDELYCNDKGYMMTGVSLKYLCAVLNSSLITWWISNTAATTGMGLTEWRIVTVKRIPIPEISNIEQRPFIALVDRILTHSSDGLSSVETTAPQEELDRLVYGVYGLSKQEIAVVEASVT